MFLKATQQTTEKLRRLVPHIDKLIRWCESGLPVSGGPGVRVTSGPSGTTIVADVRRASTTQAQGSFGSVPVGTLFVVVLDQVGGSNGTATTAPTYTYDAANLDSSIEGEALSPLFARPNGAVTAASRGIAYLDPEEDNALTLLYAHEVPTTDSCA
jgi:hypothetical protein